MVNKMYVTKAKSEKTGKEYAVLRVDFGYRVADIFIEPAVLVELAGIDFAKFYSMKVNDILPIKVGL